MHAADIAMNYTFRMDVLNAFGHFQHLDEISYQYINMNSAEILVQVVVSLTLVLDQLSFSTAREYHSSYTVTQGTWKMLLHPDRSQGTAARIRA